MSLFFYALEVSNPEDVIPHLAKPGHNPSYRKPRSSRYACGPAWPSLYRDTRKRIRNFPLTGTCLCHPSRAPRASDEITSARSSDADLS